MMGEEAGRQGLGERGPPGGLRQREGAPAAPAPRTGGEGPPPGGASPCSTDVAAAPSARRPGLATSLRPHLAPVPRMGPVSTAAVVGSWAGAATPGRTRLMRSTAPRALRPCCGSPGAVLPCAGALLGRCWGGAGAVLGPSWSCPGALMGGVGPSWGYPGLCSGRPGAVLGRPGRCRSHASAGAGAVVGCPRLRACPHWRCPRDLVPDPWLPC